MFAAPAIEVLKKQSTLLCMPLFAAAFYSTFGLYYESSLPETDSILYWPAFVISFFIQTAAICGFVHLLDMAIFFAQPFMAWLRPLLGLTCLTVGFLPLAGITQGEAGNLLWPVAMLTFGFRLFQED